MSPIEDQKIREEEDSLCSHFSSDYLLFLNTFLNDDL